MTILINLNDARKKLYELEGSAEYNKGVTDAFNALFDLPIVEAEPKHGRWVHKYGDGHEEPAITGGECSICGYVHTVTNYCPNCGAKMDEVEE